MDSRQNAERDQHLLKARDNLVCAEAELAAGRYNTCASRAYYAAFHAAIAALLAAGERPIGAQWGHEYVESRFGGMLVYRRKLYGPELRDTLGDLAATRRLADYAARSVDRRQAAVAIEKARSLVTAVE